MEVWSIIFFVCFSLLFSSTFSHRILFVRMVRLPLLLSLLFLSLFLFFPSSTNCFTTELFTNLQVSAQGQGAVIATYTFSQIHPGPFVILYNGVVTCTSPPPPPPPPSPPPYDASSSSSPPSSSPPSSSSSSSNSSSPNSSSPDSPSTLTSSSYPSLGVSVTLKTSFGQMDLIGTAAGSTSYDLPLSISNSFYFDGLADQDNSSLIIQFQLATPGQLGYRDSYCSIPSTGMEDRHSAVLTFGTSGFGEKYYLTYNRPPFVGWLCRYLFVGSLVVVGIGYAMWVREGKTKVVVRERELKTRMREMESEGEVERIGTIN